MQTLHVRSVAAIVLAAVAASLGSASSALAQQGIDLRGPLQASSGGTLLGNRPGMSIGRTPPGAYQRRDVLPQARPDQLAPAPAIPDFPLENPARVDTSRSLLGDPGGMTLEQAVDRLCQFNPAVAAARSEMDQARSDIITAGLRANPQFFADMQQVPYRTLAPGQADVNLAYPIDVSGKRRTLVKSAVCVLRSVEWKYRDFVRTQVDNLDTLFVDTLVAQEMVRAYKQGGPEALQVPRFRFDVTQASALDEAETRLRDNRQALALLLNLPEPESIRLQGTVYDWRYFDDRTSGEQKARLASLRQAALANRPDVQAQRWALCRALADVDAVRASRFDDVTFLVQPYTYSPALPDRVGWALGVTVPLPIYNRQQGNLAKARQIVAQTEAQLAALENTVTAEVEAAYNAVGDTWGDMVRFRAKTRRPTEPPPKLKPTDLPKEQVVAEYLASVDPLVRELVRRENETGERNFYNAVIQHRKSLLRLNTACACNVWPVDPTGPAPASVPDAGGARTLPAGGGRP